MEFNHTYSGWLMKGRTDAKCPDCGEMFTKAAPRSARCDDCRVIHNKERWARNRKARAERLKQEKR